MRITLAALVIWLLNLRGSTFATFVFNTDARLKKTGNPYKGVRKVVKVNGQLNFHYDAAVLNRLAREGKDADSFVRGESWHEPVKRTDGTLTPLAAKKGTSEPTYVRFRLLKQVAGPAYFEVGGKELTAEQVQPFLPAKSEYLNQGTDDPVIFLTYGIDAIRSVKTEGEEFFIAD